MLHSPLFTSTIYFDDLASGKKHDAKKASTTAYKWLEAEFPEHSSEIKTVKDPANEQTAHASVLNSQQKFVAGAHPEIRMAYFDFDDDHWTKVDLWDRKGRIDGRTAGTTVPGSVESIAPFQSVLVG
ncbi:hypothetical protein [Paraburkholderia aspalathi]|uniref:Uncharacterized protein n=1 Tax=Paraburkholderia aspalathi TaxID=1324617 RepID=A0A1I6YIU7_9BURK|nr:hypothetical protein [Paraburkholderia aspalathi]SFT50322.1 hypothetical protein SAMN05192563_1001518 [Paraburkholderia aspalathi]